VRDGPGRQDHEVRVIDEFQDGVGIWLAEEGVVPQNHARNSDCGGFHVGNHAAWISSSAADHSID
jgi:hypothetical protein